MSKQNILKAMFAPVHLTWFRCRFLCSSLGKRRTSWTRCPGSCPAPSRAGAGFTQTVRGARVNTGTGEGNNALMQWLDEGKPQEPTPKECNGTEVLS
jgi:hypothetical protein